MGFLVEPVDNSKLLALLPYRFTTDGKKARYQ